MTDQPRPLRRRATTGVVRRTFIAVVTGGTCVGLAVAPDVAGAAAPLLSAGCTQTAAVTVTCSYNAAGEHPVVVPAGTLSASATAVGGTGGDDGMGGAAGGAGAVVAGPIDLPADGGTVYAVVGGNGPVGAFGFFPGGTPAGGANGGGGSDGILILERGGGGGGASDVRTLPTTDPATLTSRVLVAAGGGGASFGGGGGAAGQAAAPYSGDPGRAGQPGTATAGGNNGYGSSPGSLGQGGTGRLGGGGGGGGLYGGGGANQGGAGGGGGSSLVPTTGTFALADAGTAPSVTIVFKLGIPQTITFTSTPPAGAMVGERYTVTATGGGSGNPVTFASASAACSVSGSTVTFAGAGICVIDANQAGDADYLPASQVSQTVPVAPAAPALTITTTSLPAGTVSDAYTATLQATGGSGAPWQWSLAPGSSLPPGLMLSGEGHITGSPRAAGTFTFTVSVNNQATRTLSITVNSAQIPRVPSGSLPVTGLSAPRLIAAAAASVFLGRAMVLAGRRRRLPSGRTSPR